MLLKKKITIALAGLAVLGSLGGCECGFLQQLCTERHVCSCVDDQFALLHGRAIRAYLIEFEQRYCNAHGIGCAGCPVEVTPQHETATPAPSPEVPQRSHN